MLEAANPEGEEFGDEGLVAALRSEFATAGKRLLEAVVATVKEYAPGNKPMT